MSGTKIDAPLNAPESVQHSTKGRRQAMEILANIINPGTVIAILMGIGLIIAMVVIALLLHIWKEKGLLFLIFMAFMCWCIVQGLHQYNLWCESMLK